MKQLTALLAVLSLGSLAGCTGLLMGGAAAGGYQLGKDERPPAEVTRDGATTATIKSKLVADSTVSALNVNVDTYAGHVTLRGTVGSYAERQRAEDIANSVERVRSVDNQLKVVRPE